MVGRILIIWMMWLASLSLYGQVANVTEGCIPLTVEFAAPQQASYFWDFDDSTSSTQQSPDHIFTSAGTYEVSLFDQQGGTLVGSVTITVYADPQITMTFSQSNICAPSEVTFTPSIIINPNINILSYTWVFGDGNTSNEMMPTHTYQNPGTFTASLSIETDLLECDIIQIFPNTVQVNGLNSNFIFQSPDQCSTPAEVTFIYTGDVLPGNQYLWNFGNGETSTSQGPVTAVYTQSGTFPVELQVTADNGCVTSRTANVIVGNEGFTFDPSDHACLDGDFVINTLINCDEFQWNIPSEYEYDTLFHGNDISDGPWDPLLVGRFVEEGTATFGLICTTPSGCTIDTTFAIEVVKPTAAFTIDPPMSCEQDVDLILNPENPNYASYIIDSIFYQPGEVFEEIRCPEQDSFFANDSTITSFELIVIDEFGCTDTAKTQFLHMKTEACYQAMPNNGCAPLVVRFNNMTKSISPLGTSTWDMGDGTILTSEDLDQVVHVYTEPGDYYTKMWTTNSEGCQDTSAGVWIHVGEAAFAEALVEIVAECGIVQEFNVELINQEGNIDSWSIGGYVTSHCEDVVFTQGPTIVTNTLILEDNGCFTELPQEFDIEATGTTLPNILYRIDCDRPNQVLLQQTNELQPGETMTWVIDGTEVSSDFIYTHTFDGPGNYFVAVTITNPGCPSETGGIFIEITDITAILVVPEQVCLGDSIVFNANNSRGVWEESLNPYTFTYREGERPRSVDGPLFRELADEAGTFTATLSVIDANGCTNETEVTYTVSDIKADFSLPSDSICANGMYPFTDLSISDSDIVDYEWASGVSDESNPILTYDQIDTLIENSVLMMQLVIEDAFGCTDTIQKDFDLFTFDAEIALSGPQGICIGESLTFTAETELAEGTFDVAWDFGTGQTGDQVTETVQFDTTGLFFINLDIIDPLYSCVSSAESVVDVVALPMAAFNSTIDSSGIICHPAIIEFFDESNSENGVEYTWNMSGTIVEDNPNPSFTFDKGENFATMIVSHPYGCADSTSIEFTLVGPEGELFIEDDTLCFGEQLSASLSGLVEVNNISWDLGDGTVIDGSESITHNYNSPDLTASTIVKAVLSSDDNGCELILEQPIVIGSVPAEITFEIDTGFCANTVIFATSDQISDMFDWNFGDGTSGTGPSPTHVYSESGEFLISVNAVDAETGCRSSGEFEVDVDALDSSFEIPNMFTPNGDSTNDFFNYIYLEPNIDEVRVTAFKVYNRWGNLIYDNNDPTNGWDGRIDGKLAPSEVYAYYIELDVADCGTQGKKGNVTLVR